MPDTKNSARPKKLLRQLGKISDHELAAEFNLSTYRVRAERIKRSILAFKYGSWTPENTALLGTMTDKQAASLAGVTTNAAFTKRVSMGIPPFGKSSEDAKFQWTEAHQRSLGKVPDETLAEELGISASVVSAKRQSMGIMASRPVQNIRKPWKKQELAMLGKKPDTVVAEKTGRGRRHVRAKRESLGIPPFQQHTTIRWTVKTIKKLRSMPDHELAKELGVALSTVALHRRRLGIPAHSSNPKTN